MVTPEEILAFWFNGLDDHTPLTPDDPRVAHWFESDPAFDARLAERFGAMHEEASRGGLVAWEDGARPRLALILVLDQFSRNLHRGAPDAYANDARAQALALRSLEDGTEASLSRFERVFLYMPLEHAEDLALQDRSVACFEALLAEVQTKAPSQAPNFEASLDYARRHRAIIDRFGRFPHRNATLDRTTTTEESDFLETPGSSF